MIYFSFGAFTLPVPVLGFFFYAELAAAELLFLGRFERKTPFVLRCAAANAAGLLAVWGWYIAEYYGTAALMQITGAPFAVKLFDTLRYVTVIAVTACVGVYCFGGKVMRVVSACTAGYAVQHFAYKLSMLGELALPLYGAVGNPIA